MVTAAMATLAVALLAAVPIGAFVRPSGGATECAASGYSYEGHASAGSVGRVAATIAAVATPRVASGHVAAWVGVGDTRSHHWLQAGVAAFRGTTLRLYYELALPGMKRRYVELDRDVALRDPHRIAVTETAPGWWRVEVDGSAVTAPIFVGESWRGVATAESWTAAHAPCNRYGFRFDRVSGAGASAFAARA